MTLRRLRTSRPSFEGNPRRTRVLMHHQGVHANGLNRMYWTRINLHGTTCLVTAVLWRETADSRSVVPMGLRGWLEERRHGSPL